MSTDTPKGFFVFDRDGIGHDWERALRELTSSHDESRCAVAKNWQMDHRVSHEREEHDLHECRCFKTDSGGEEWLRSLRDYHAQCICQPSDAVVGARSVYLETWNENNRIHSVAPFDYLCHVESLRGIVRRVSGSSFAADASAELLLRLGLQLPEKSPGDTTPNWLDSKLEKFAGSIGNSTDRICAAAGILLDKLKSTAPPWWACFAEGVQDEIDAGAAKDLCEDLGLGHLKSPDWLFVLSYPVKAAGKLYRPTVAEASNNPFHFPSPPDVGFGIPMHLTVKFSDDSTSSSLREVLHRPLKGSEVEEWCTGKLLPLENFQERDDTLLRDLRKLRRLHGQRLRSEFQDDTQKTWLSRHLEL